MTVLIVVGAFGGFAAVVFGALFVMRLMGVRTLTQDLDELQRIREVGRRSEAVVRSIRETGSSVNDASVAQLELELQGVDGKPYVTSALWVVSSIEVPRVQPGCTVPVAVDPADPKKVALVPLT